MQQLNIRYGVFENEWEEYPGYIQDLVCASEAKKICDIGGGANPLLDIEFVVSRELEYTVLDISKEELDKADRRYNKLCKDIQEEPFLSKEKYDLVISRMVAEHVRSGHTFHKNVFSILNSGGLAVHFFPTLWALPFLVNKLLPDDFSSVLLNLFAPRNRIQNAKFPAYYDLCFGPTSKMLKEFSALDYEVVEFCGYFGNNYWRRVPILNSAHQAFSRFLFRFPNPHLTSYSRVTLRKPFSS
ncbi:MAG: class I SAM-dependent methyltransferase [Anaerolineales bacterium]|nr:class I SAM-dependent methyltransferase [Anaerolineales bacterium]